MVHTFTTPGFRVVAAVSVPPLRDEYRRRAQLAETFDLAESSDYLFLAAGPATRDWPSLVVEQRYSPGPISGFQPGIHVAEDASTLFVGAGTRILAYDLTAPRRLWEAAVDCGFWGWRQHGAIVVMSAELELAAFGAQGTRLWSSSVEPPWHYAETDGQIQLDVMGNITEFPIAVGPRS